MSSDIKPKIKFWNDPKKRSYCIQTCVLLLVLWGLGYFISNVAHNLEKQGIATGFDFLGSTSGFSIIQSLIPYSETSTYGGAFLVGLTNTFLVSFLGIIFATLLGFIMGVSRLSSNWVVSRIAAFYVETMRNIPLLLQIFFWYFVVLRSLPAPRQSFQLFEQIFLNNRGIYMPSILLQNNGFLPVICLVAGLCSYIPIKIWAKKRHDSTGKSFPALITVLALSLVLCTISILVLDNPLSLQIPALQGFNFQGGWVIIPELAALLAALVTYTAAFIAEIVRAGILAVSKGQKEAAAALGLKHSVSTRLIVIPQALRVIIPPLTSQYLNLTKNSSLAAAIGYPDLVSVFSGTVLNQTGQAVEVIAITMTVYLTISLSISSAMNWYNKKITLQER